MLAGCSSHVNSLPPTNNEERITKNACLRCGTCCRWPGHVFLVPEDVTLLAKHVGMGEAEFISSYTRLASNRGGLSLTEQPDGACVFLNGNTCSVYDGRPKQCREFPKGWKVEGCPESS